MPEIARFFGIIIRMYAEHSTKHHTPHFHAYYQDFEIVIAIKAIKPITGEIPRKQLKLIFVWTELHQMELFDNWHLLQNGELPDKINPLR